MMAPTPTPRQDKERDDQLPAEHVGRSRSRSGGGSYSLARFVIASGITGLWAAVNLRYFFGNGPSVSTEFNVICGSAVAYIVGVEGIVKKIRGKD
jgi:hypothetical protein